MKRITDGWMPKLRTEGLKGANKLFAKVKAGSGLAGKGINGAAKRVVPSSVASRGTAQELWLGLLFTEILWMMLLAIDFTSMTWSRQKQAC
jgi:hypothetical protein